jgi:AraC family transcriptional regulator, transcriptional activator of pobA
VEKTESLQEFYKRVPTANPLGLDLDNAGPGHFNVYPRDAYASSLVSPHRRRDFYKVSMIIGTGRLHYANQWIVIDRPALLFSNPFVPYSWEQESEEQKGWFCVFTETFLPAAERKEILHDGPLFRVGSNPVFFLNEAQQTEIAGIYQKMVQEIASDYPQKYNILRSCLQLIMYEALKTTPAEGFRKHANASSRIASLFLELLERQFPIDSPRAALKLKTANEYAMHLSVHTNHLNRSVKEITGKTTTALIADRIRQEAEALLRHSDWSISEIAYGLGSEYPAYFTNFFRKNTGHAPLELRKSIV